MIEPNENTVVIVGPPCAGKSTLSAELAEKFPEHHVYHTDDYIDKNDPRSFETSVYRLLDDVRRDGHTKIIIEGVQSARVLRKGLEQSSLYADLVIKLEPDNGTLEARYFAREGKQYPHASRKGIETVYNDYMSKVQRMPRVVTVSNYGTL